MPAYDYDDDDLDYSDDGGNSPMNFKTERDLDDYLNDEEYDMMGLIFPEVLDYLKSNHYYGYDNLTVKLAIFDSNFNIDEAKLELSEVLKQKKPEISKPIKKTPNLPKKSTYIDLSPLWTLFFHCF